MISSGFFKVATLVYEDRTGRDAKVMRAAVQMFCGHCTRVASSSAALNGRH